MQIIIYTGPGCGRCTALKAALRSRGIRHDITDIGVDPGAADHLRAAGQRELPVVEIDGDIVGAGFSPALIALIEERHALATALAANH